jgi:hypothetical protein
MALKEVLWLFNPLQIRICCLNNSYINESLGLPILSICLGLRSARARSAAKNPLVLKVNWIKTQSQCLEFFWISLQACRHPLVKCFFSSSRFLQVQSSFVAITVHTEKTETGNVQPFFLPSVIIYRCAKRSLFPDIKYRCENSTAKVIEHFLLVAQTNRTIYMYTSTAHYQK